MTWVSKCLSCYKGVKKLFKDGCGHQICARCVEEGCLVCGKVRPMVHDLPKEGK